MNGGMMEGMGSMMGWMMGLGVLGWVVVIAILVTIVVLLAQTVRRGVPGEGGGPHTPGQGPGKAHG